MSSYECTSDRQKIENRRRRQLRIDYGVAPGHGASQHIPSGGNISPDSWETLLLGLSRTQPAASDYYEQEENRFAVAINAPMQREGHSMICHDDKIIS